MREKTISLARYARPPIGVARLLAAVSICVVGIACNDESNTLAPESTVSSTTVTGAAAGALTADGKFVLASPTLSAEEIDGPTAQHLAAAYATSFGPMLRGKLEYDRGGRIDVEQLKSCGPAYYAASVYQAIIPTGDPVRDNAVRYVGPVWMTTLCEKGVAKVSVAVSTSASTARVERGQLRGVSLPNDFSMTGIPINAVTIPTTPEAAVAFAVKKSGLRVSQVPELVLPPPPFPPQLARWRLTLESNVKVTGTKSKTSRATAELYVGFGDDWRTHGLLVASTTEHGMSALRMVSSKNGAASSVPLTKKSKYADALELVEVTP